MAMKPTAKRRRTVLAATVCTIAGSTMSLRHGDAAALHWTLYGMLAGLIVGLSFLAMKRNLSKQREGEAG